jgi:N-acetylglucosamine kinase-like BadF-type ATPase
MADQVWPITTATDVTCTIQAATFDNDGVITNVGTASALSGQILSGSAKVTNGFTEKPLADVLQVVRVQNSQQVELALDGVIWKGKTTANAIMKLFKTYDLFKVVIVQAMSSAAVGASVPNTQTYYVAATDFDYKWDNGGATFSLNAISIGVRDNSGNNIDWAYTAV